MQIHLKRLGKKKIKIIEITLENNPETLEQLIQECVRSEVKRFNESRLDTSLLPFPKKLANKQKKGGLPLEKKKIEN